MSKFNLKVSLAAAFTASLALAPAAQAGVVTTGCASATSCTLTELGAGGTLTIDDVLFDNFTLLTQNAPTQIDLSTVSITGISTGTSVILDFLFDPAIAFNAETFSEIDFTYDATVDGGSSRTLIDAAQAFDTGDASFTGIAGTTVATQINGGPLDELFIEEDDLGSVSSDNSALSNLLMLNLLTDIETGVFDIESTSNLMGFFLEFTLDGVFSPPMGEVPLPAAFPLMFSGLLGLGFLNRRKRRS